MSCKMRILARTGHRFLQRSNALVAALLMVFVPLQSMGQSTFRPDALIEAAMYEARARDQMSCCLEDAERWCRKTIETGRRFRSSERAERDMAGALVARAEMLLVEIRSKREQTRDVSRMLGKLMNDNRLQSAERLLAENADLASQPQISSLKSELEHRSSQVQFLIERGDRIVRIDPGGALRFYEQARKADQEHPLLASKIDVANQSKRSMRNGSAGKVILIGLLLAAIGGAAYYEYEKQKQLNAAR
ncbi:MAG: hypothetical protein ABSH28_15400, partial [Acidobacteriota bacterium]